MGRLLADALVGFVSRDTRFETARREILALAS